MSGRAPNRFREATLSASKPGGKARPRGREEKLWCSTAAASLHSEAVANAQAKEEEQYDTKGGLNSRDDLEPSWQALKQFLGDQILADTEKAKCVGEAKTECTAPEGVPGEGCETSPRRNGPGSARRLK